MSQLRRRETVSLCVPNPLASWELRIGDLRVYYDVEEDPEQQVNIVAIGMKRRNRVSIGGELYDI